MNLKVYYYCLFEAVLRMCVMIRMRIRILGSVPLTNGSGRGSGRPKNIRIWMRIRIRNADHLHHWKDLALFLRGFLRCCGGLFEEKNKLRFTIKKLGVAQTKLLFAF
jgi:hypothetical protein